MLLSVTCNNLFIRSDPSSAVLRCMSANTMQCQGLGVPLTKKCQRQLRFVDDARQETFICFPFAAEIYALCNDFQVSQGIVSRRHYGVKLLALLILWRINSGYHTRIPNFTKICWAFCGHDNKNVLCYRPFPRQVLSPPTCRALRQSPRNRGLLFVSKVLNHVGCSSHISSELGPSHRPLYKQILSGDFSRPCPQ